MEEGLGGKFWAGLIGVVLACGAGAFVIFLVMNRAIYRWGAIGALIAFSCLLLLVGWIYDRRHKKEWAEQFAEDA